MQLQSHLKLSRRQSMASMPAEIDDHFWDTMMSTDTIDLLYLVEVRLGSLKLATLSIA